MLFRSPAIEIAYVKILEAIKEESIPSSTLSKLVTFYSIIRKDLLIGSLKHIRDLYSTKDIAIVDFVNLFSMFVDSRILHECEFSVTHIIKPVVDDDTCLKLIVKYKEYVLGLFEKYQDVASGFMHILAGKCKAMSDESYNIFADELSKFMPSNNDVPKATPE